MPIKQKHAHHKGHTQEKHTKKFMKAYAPYLPLLLIVGFGLFLSTTGDFKKLHGNVLSYATNMTDTGLLDATNKARVDNKLEPLKYNAVLDQAAQAKAEDMANRNYWSHNTPDGKEPWAFIDNTGYKYFKAAENLAYGFDNSDATVVGWMNSPSHRANVLDKDLVEVGFGVINITNYQNKGPETVVVAMYGLPPPQSLATNSSTPGNPVTSIPIVASSSMSANNAASESKRISYAQMLTGGAAPWISFALGVAIGLMLMYLILKHLRGVMQAIRNGESFILRHPLLDTTLVALIALATIVSQTAGIIH